MIWQTRVGLKQLWFYPNHQCHCPQHCQHGSQRLKSSPSSTVTKRVMMQQSGRAKERRQCLWRLVTVLATSLSTTEIKETTLRQLPCIWYLVQSWKEESIARTVTITITSFSLQNKLDKTFFHLWQCRHTGCREGARLEDLHGCRSLTNDQADEILWSERTFGCDPRGLWWRLVVYVVSIWVSVLETENISVMTSFL